MPMPSIYTLLKKLWIYIKPRRKFQFIFLLVLMIATSCSEILGIGSVIPLLSAILNPESLLANSSLNPLFVRFGISSASQLIVGLSGLFILLTAVINVMRSMLLWFNARLTNSISTELSYLAYQNVLHQPYEVHISRSVGEVIHGILLNISIAANQIGMVLTLMNAVVLSAGILIAIIVFNPYMAFFIGMVVSIFYLLIGLAIKEQLLSNSARHTRYSKSVMSTVIEGIGGIRDVLLDGMQKTYAQAFREKDYFSKRALGNIQILGAAPRFIIETIGMSAIVIAAATFSLVTGDPLKSIPLLGATALGALRLLPIIQSGFYAWSNIQGNKMALNDAVLFLDQSLNIHSRPIATNALNFQSSIMFKDVDYRYPGQSKNSLSGINFEIKKGDRIGLIGKTASGKSTFMDILLGLLKPSGGGVYVDGVLLTEENCAEWQMQLAHVPQSIFLTDATIAENIAFGVPKEKVNMVRVAMAADIAQLTQDFSDLNERVGERGVRLSGGQKQRIGIARAIYKNVSTYIFDEATSALDSETEENVMNAIEGWALKNNEKLTLVFIAHRKSTLRNCNTILELDSGKISRIGSYRDIIGS